MVGASAAVLARVENDGKQASAQETDRITWPQRLGVKPLLSSLRRSELVSCVKVEVAVLGSRT